MSEIESWLIEPPKWTVKHRKIIQVKKRDKIEVNLEEILQKSENFTTKFPRDAFRNKELLKTVPTNILERNVQSAYPVIHEAALYLCVEFLLFKQEHGSKVEKKLYKNMTVFDFIQRLLVKRAVAFVGNRDSYILRNGFTGHKPNWEKIGTDKEKKPLILTEYLSYDELKLSAFLSVSSYSYFINDSHRFNSGVPEEDRDKIEPEGIIIGLIGPRMKKKNVMEVQETVLSEHQNITSAPTTVNLFLNFYQETTFSYENVLNGHIPKDCLPRFKDLETGFIFDNSVYAKRLAVSFDTLLIEANCRAKEVGKYGYVHVVGIGLGVWRLSKHQDEVFLETFGKRIRALGSNLNNISDIDFSYFSKTGTCLGYANGDVFPIEGHPLGGIKIHFSFRQPFSKLPTNDKLLVVSYAWDSNALPGNEFWDGSTGTSSDSATANACQISEIHNPFINPAVCADNLMLVTARGLVPAYDYLHQVLEKLGYMEVNEDVGPTTFSLFSFVTDKFK